MKKLYRQKSKDIHILGYYIKDNLIGTVTLDIQILPSGKEAIIWDLAIMEEYRRLGIATKLMNRAEEIAKKKEIKRIWLFSGFHRKCAHELYKKLGKEENFFDLEKFAGEGNIGHMLQQAEIYKNQQN